MKQSTKLSVVSFLAISALACGNAAKEQPKDKVEKPTPTENKTPETKAPESTTHESKEPIEAKASDLKDAVSKLDATYQELAGIVKDGDLSKAHEAADKLSKFSALLPELAQKSGLAAADIDEIKKAATTIEGLFTPMDQSGDAGNRDLAQKVFAKYEAPMTMIKEKTK
jgi:hypothetical protein